MENQVIDLDFTQWLNFVNILKLEATLWWFKHIDEITTQTLAIVINFDTKHEKKYATYHFENKLFATTKSTE
jgi:hypothetical protein